MQKNLETLKFLVKFIKICVNTAEANPHPLAGASRTTYNRSVERVQRQQARIKSLSQHITL